MTGARRIVLASASPRRRTLLAEAGLSFEVVPADVDEDVVPGASPEATAEELALRKARAVAARRRDGLVLGADTVVAVDDAVGATARLLGKPADEAEASAMLARLSGTRHRVVTGVAVVRVADGAARVDHERTWVTMRPIADAERAAYVASGEWRDKAGGYAIQESADAFVERLEGGGFDNVVGLPVALALRLIGELG